MSSAGHHGHDSETDPPGQRVRHVPRRGTNGALDIESVDSESVNQALSDVRLADPSITGLAKSRVRVHFLRDMVRDGAVKLIKCAGTQNVADALTKSLPKPAFHKHREFLHGTAKSFSAFYAAARVTPVVAYVSRVTKHNTVVLSKPLVRCPGG